MTASETVVVAGHPLVAQENRLPFESTRNHMYRLLVPTLWNAPSAGKLYAGEGGDERMIPLRVFGQGRNSFYLWRELERTLRTLRPALVYAWGEPWCLSTWQLLGHCRRLNIPMVFYAAENKTKRLPPPFAQIESRVLAGAWGCVAISKEAVERVIRRGFGGRIYRIPLWTRRFHRLSPDPQARRLVYLGRMIPLKRVDWILRALPHLPDYRARLVGDGPERGALERLARDLGVQDRVEFTGSVPNHQLREALEDCSLLVMPTAESQTRAEQFGKAVIEAAALGIPVLTSATGHFRELAREFSTVSAHPLEGPLELARRVVELHSEYPPAQALEQVRRGVEEKYGGSSVGELFGDCFRECLTDFHSRSQHPIPPTRQGARNLARRLEYWSVWAWLRVSRRFGPTTVANGPPRGPILFTKTCCLGDAVLSLYAIRELKRKHPSLRMDMLCSHRIADVYRSLDLFGTVHSLPIWGKNPLREMSDPRFWLAAAGTLGRLRKQRYAELVDLELYRSYPGVLRSLLGIRASRGFSLEGAPLKGHDRTAERPRDMPEWKCFYGLLGLEIPGDDPPPLYSDVGAGGGIPTVGVVFGASFNWPQKRWPLVRFAELIRRLHLAGPLRFVAFGLRGEEEDMARLRRLAGFEISDRVGKTDFGTLKREVAACDCVVGNDTGTMHLAAACGVPTVTLFGPTNPVKWNPLTSIPLYFDIACRPCYYLSNMPACRHLSCLYKLDVDRVYDAVLEQLKSRRSKEARNRTSSAEGTR